jgi:hypothetical protein
MGKQRLRLQVRKMSSVLVSDTDHLLLQSNCHSFDMKNVSPFWD